MRISVFGLGYVGTVCAACLAHRGHKVIGVDRVEAKVDLIRSGRSPVIERDIDELIKSTVSSGHLTATADPSEAVKSTDMSIVCVGTPSQRNGALSVSAIEAVSAQIGQIIRSKVTRHEVVIRSTVLPGTTRGTIVPLLIDASGKHPGDAFGVAFNPEFMREGCSVADFNTPSRTVVGSLEQRSTDAVLSLYDHLPGSKIATNIETAELAKYVDNTWHALKVSFTNEIAILASTLGIDSHEVMDIFFEDNKLNISTAYMRPGFAFGGSCLPKDVRALAYLARTLDLSLPIVTNILTSNQMLVNRGLEWVLAESMKRVGFLGISFKAGTDDLRESPFVDLVERVKGKGREVRIFDANLNLANLIGGNKDYLMGVLPHIAEMMVPRISDVTAWADTVVVTSADPTYIAEIATVGADKVVLDFAKFHQPGRSFPEIASEQGDRSAAPLRAA
jgi:GDP-mannose 6-dehydrogenase